MMATMTAAAGFICMQSDMHHWLRTLVQTSTVHGREVTPYINKVDKKMVKRLHFLAE